MAAQSIRRPGAACRSGRTEFRTTGIQKAIIPEEGTLNAPKAAASAKQVGKVGKAIIGAGASSGKALIRAESLAAEYGGEAKDWAKMVSSGFKSAHGTIFQAHWYKNVVTGAQVEYKTALY